MRDGRTVITLGYARSFFWFVAGITFFSYRDYIVNKPQTVDCLRLKLGVTVHELMLISICQCLCHIMIVSWSHGFKGLMVSMVSWFHRFRGVNGFMVS